MAEVFVALGSNLGDRPANLARAIESLKQLPETKLLTCSPWHETAPVGGPAQGMYLNGVAQIETTLTPQELLTRLKEIERALGRPPQHERWGPRVIDLDLLAYNALILKEPGLILPHPQMHERSFVLAPLAQIAPQWRHPQLGKTALEMLENLSP